MSSPQSFYSTQNQKMGVSLKDALFYGLAADGGLFLPLNVPKMPESFFKSMAALDFPDIAFAVAQQLIGDAVPEDVLRAIVQESFPFDAPLVEVERNRFALELFHGPTLSFKDFGARFMARLFRYFMEPSKETLHVLVATSGDTGSAVAHGFYRVPGIEVWVLYPSGKVSPVQEQQMVTLGHNVHAVEVQGTFDDCQRFVKEAFNDADLRKQIQITSANSINIARLIPQIFYYFYAFAQLKEHGLPLVFSVPSGNFGNLCAGLLAKRMGLPVSHFVAATNVNDVVPEYLSTGNFIPRASIHTLSNAMDVGNPSNFARMLDLYDHSIEKMRKEIFGASFTDQQTLKAISDVYQRSGYILDPHGAVAYLGLNEYAQKHPQGFSGIFLATAHPAKFSDAVEQSLGRAIEMPPSLKECLHRKKVTLLLPVDYQEFKSILLNFA